MNSSRIARKLFILPLLVVAAGCSSPPSHFYSLTSTARSTGAPETNYEVEIAPVSIPASVDQPQFVVQTGPNQVEVDEFNRWVAPLGDSIARVVAANLVTLLGTPHVSMTPPMDYPSAYVVTIDIQRFEAIQGESVHVEATWFVRPPSGGASISRRTVATESLSKKGYDAIAAGYSRALAVLSSDIAEAIRSKSAQKP
jgi:uncharacterized protein